MTRTVRLLAFAGARDLLGFGERFLKVESADAASLLAELCQEFPPLEPYRASLRLAINGAYALGPERLSEGDEVAVLPPVSGG
jgi:molybdopterin converting factor small subunit